MVQVSWLCPGIYIFQHCIDSLGNASVVAWPNYSYNRGIEKTSRRYLNDKNVYNVRKRDGQ